MNAEVGFLVFILYFYLFLDLFSSLEKHLYANAVDHVKKLRQKKVERKNLAICSVGKVKRDERRTDLPEISFYREMWQPRVREYEQMVTVQKWRLWGRS